MPYDHETGLTSKSIFEQVMCSFMADEFGTCWDQKYGVHMDIWRDTYIWNSMITDNDYEENGSDSEFEWFEPKNFDWDPEDSDFVGYYDEHHYMNINY